MTPRLRRLALTAHVVLSVGWLGAVAAYLAPASVSLASSDPDVVRSCQLVMEKMGWYVIVPLGFGALLSGLVQSLITEWGLVRHYWVATKLALTIVGLTILVLHMGRFVTGHTGHAKAHLFAHAVGGIVILLAATTLSIVKPWGKTPIGRRRAA